MAKVPKEIQELAAKMGGEVRAFGHEELKAMVLEIFKDELEEVHNKLHAAKIEAMVALHRLGGSMLLTQEEVGQVTRDYTLEHRLDTATYVVQVYLRLKE